MTIDIATLQGIVKLGVVISESNGMYYVDFVQEDGESDRIIEKNDLAALYDELRVHCLIDPECFRER